MSKKSMTGVGVIAVIAVAGYFGMSHGVPVDTVIVSTGPIRAYIEERAKTRLPEIYRISMPQNGRVLPIDLKERDPVKRGQVVARLDPGDFETDVARGTARVERLKKMIVENADERLERNAILGFDEYLRSMQLVIESAKLQTTASQEKSKFADREYRRKSTLFESTVVSESERNEAELFQIESRVAYQKDVLVLSALQAIDSALKIGRQSIEDYIDKKQLRRAVLEQEQHEAEAERDKFARDQERVSLKSPVDGIVLNRLVSNERVLPAGEVLLEIGKIGDLEIEAEILTQDVVRLKVGDPVDVEGPAIGSIPIRGEVDRIYPQGFTKISSLGVEQQRVLVIIRFNPDDLRQLKDAGRDLGVDYRVRVRIYTDQKEDAIKVPRSALFRNAAGTWQVFAVRNGRAALVDVEIGLANDFEVEITNGLNAGESVLLAPESSITDGLRVEPRQTTAASAG